MAQITMNIQTLDWTMGETVGFALTALRPKDLEYLEKTLERNQPYKIRGGHFGDDEIVEVRNGKIVEK